MKHLAWWVNTAREDRVEGRKTIELFSFYFHSSIEIDSHQCGSTDEEEYRRTFHEPLRHSWVGSTTRTGIFIHRNIQSWLQSGRASVVCSGGYRYPVWNEESVKTNKDLLGSRSMISKRTQLRLLVDEEATGNGWSARTIPDEVKEDQPKKNRVSLHRNFAFECHHWQILSKFSLAWPVILRFDCFDQLLLEVRPLEKDEKVSPYTSDLTLFLFEVDLYFLFNPWQKEDACALPSPDQITEYVMNEHGQIYLGSSDKPQATPWYFGQFGKICFTHCSQPVGQSSTSSAEPYWSIDHSSSAVVEDLLQSWDQQWNLSLVLQRCRFRIAESSTYQQLVHLQTVSLFQWSIHSRW